MRFKLALLVATIILVQPGKTAGIERPFKSLRYTIQVGSFSTPAQARQLVTRLASLGERLATSVVDLMGRGSWTRVFVGTFATAGEARSHAARLISSGAIREFLIRVEQDHQPVLLKTPDRNPHPTGLFSSTATFISAAAPKSPVVGTNPVLPTIARASSGLPEINHARGVSSLRSHVARVDRRAPASDVLPRAKTLSLSLTPGIDTRLLPRPDPARLAFHVIAGPAGHHRAARLAGLWITGDTGDALARLRWIAGEAAAELIGVEPDGRVKLDTRLLAEAAGVDRVPLLDGPLAVIDYICSNEGLLLLVQLTQGRHRYRLHFARQAPTRGATVQVTGGINLDNNFDSRINPNRRLGRKMDNELPPDGFDSLVAINPVARWFNQQTNQLVPGAHIAFHEMAEAHAKLEMGLDYLSDGTRPGAHDVALEREKRLKSQRPLAGVVLTAGPNRVLRSEDEIREFLSRHSGSGHNR